MPQRYDQVTYAQRNPGLFIRMSKEQMDIIRKEAKKRRWSMASLVSYIIEQYLELPESDINRR